MSRKPDDDAPLTAVERAVVRQCASAIMRQLRAAHLPVLVTGIGKTRVWLSAPSREAVR